MTKISKEKCIARTGDWIMQKRNSQENNTAIPELNCGNLGCQRGLVVKGDLAYLSGPCLIGVIATQQLRKANEIIIKTNPKYL